MATARENPRTTALVAAYALLTLAYLLFRTHQPVSIQTNQLYDDDYFMAQAQLLRDGHWLGDYGPHTLVKAPGYTYFLVLNNLLGTSYTFAMAVLHLVACAVLVRTLVRTLGAPRIAGFCVFAALLLQPVSVPVRIYRDAYSDSLLLLALAGFLTVLLGPRTSRWRVLQWIGTGLALGMFWITREESTWIAPTLLALVVAAVFRERRSSLRTLVGTALALGVVVVTAAVPSIATAGINKAEYGTFVVSDFTRGPFQALVVQLDRIGGVPEIPRIPVPNEALAAAFRASPTFAELEDEFASPAVRAWALPECPDSPAACGQIPGSIFSWALRDAAALAGVHSSATHADEFYRRAASELAAACGRDYPCRPRPVAAVPVLTRASVSAFPSSVRRSIALTLYQDGSVPDILPSSDDQGRFAPSRAFLGDPPTSPVAAPGEAAPFTDRSAAQKILSVAYRILTPVLVVAGALCYLWAVGGDLRGRRRMPVLLVAAGALWIAYASRVVLIALVDATTFSSIIPQYLQPAYLLGCVAAAASIVVMWTRRRDRGSGPGRHDQDVLPEDLARHEL